MCGIFGYVDVSGRSGTNQYAEEAVGLLRHRGPDEGGVWQGDGIFLGMRRLSIIDLSTGQQPIWNEDNSCAIVYNGELYNFLDLRPVLQSKGHVFRTKSDTEVVLHAYEEWGPECLQRFNGMFAFAIWDNSQRSLFLARDRIGEKPLYYFYDQHRFSFASEIKAILAEPTIPREMHLPGLANFLAFGHAVAPETIYQNISKLLPGHYLILQNGRLDLREYWDVGSEPQLPEGKHFSEADYIQYIRELLDDSVRRRMIADVPVGAFLSGGVDSSTVVALMKRHATGPVKTFSLGFDVGGGAYNELPDARAVAKYLGTEHYELNVSHTDLVKLLYKLVYHYDEPFGDAAGFPVLLISQFAREQVKVVLAGDGGDEIFGGYRRYAADLFSSYYQYLPHLLSHKLIPDLVDRLPRFRRFKQLAQFLPIPDPAKRYGSWLTCFSADLRAELFRPQIYQSIKDHDPSWYYPFYYNRLEPPSYVDHLNRILYVDFKSWLPDAYMEKVDKASMACSLEVRLPLLDHRLVELAFQIPGSYKIRGWSFKRIFKKAVRELLPESVLKKPKHGFSVPTDPWFRGALKDFTFEVLFDARTRRRKYFNFAVIERIWREHLEGRYVRDTHLWLLLNFELWHRIYLDGETF